ncbi:hypothetical protein [Xylanimonas ulmi]|uniref:Uncharacterized protein n=1 Tax=Xylanimonas ulmi TaxID=228973 RepID=A0A4V2EXR9_9MICO|nr:hypothetical protein [Xylanibacterium ulmi]RZS60450.1 hypothetical protein EV386_0708 [Xylanibacterium ulmi]
MAEWDWRELLDDPDVTDVVHRVWYYAERTFYNGPNDALALDDLSSWLWERAAEVAMKYDASVMDARDLRAPERYWQAFLYKALKQHGLPAHRRLWFGRASSARAALIPRGSLDEERGDPASGDAPTKDIFGNRRLQAVDPLAVVLLLERLEEKIASGEPIEECEPVVDGVCVHAGCDRPPRKGTRGLCAVHYRADLDRRNPDCGVEGCTNPMKCKGLCANHYEALRRQLKRAGAA